MIQEGPVSEWVHIWPVSPTNAFHVGDACAVNRLLEAVHGIVLRTTGGGFSLANLCNDAWQVLWQNKTPTAYLGGRKWKASNEHGTADDNDNDDGDDDAGDNGGGGKGDPVMCRVEDRCRASKALPAFAWGYALGGKYSRITVDGKAGYRVHLPLTGKVRWFRVDQIEFTGTHYLRKRVHGSRV